MDEKPDEIMNHIESQRDQLGRNLNELEARVKRTTDWRSQVDRNPMIAVGVALGGGVLLGSILGGGVSRPGKSTWSSSSAAKNYTSANLASSPSTGSGISSGGDARSLHGENRRRSSDTIEHIKGALVAFGVAKLKEFMNEALPGFSQHLEEAEKRGASQGPSSYASGSQFSGSGGQRPSEYRPSSGSSEYPGGTRTEQSSRSPYSQPSTDRTPV